MNVKLWGYWTMCGEEWDATSTTRGSYRNASLTDFVPELRLTMVDNTTVPPFASSMHVYGASRVISKRWVACSMLQADVKGNAPGFRKSNSQPDDTTKGLSKTFSRCFSACVERKAPTKCNLCLRPEVHP